ncbi:MAG: hypothetical protein Q8M65_09180, partial [Rhodoglobus sp.]|nr:hypothetical protein [Rhodoglobus sp.]
LLLLLVFPGCERKSPPQKAPEKAKPAAIKPEAAKPGEINLEETKLASIPEEYDKWSNISFSADGRQVFYTATKKDKNFIVVATTDGENIGPAYESVSFLVKSPDGRRFAFGGKRGGKKYLIVDNKEMRGLYSEEVAPSAFSPDGSFVACEVGSKKEKKWFISVSNGEEEVYRSPVYPDTYRQPVFSPDGLLLVFELGDDKRSIGNKKRTVFFLDISSRKAIKEKLHAGYKAESISFSSDSSRAVYIMYNDEKQFLVLQDFALNKQRKAELSYTVAGQVFLSPDGKQIVYKTTKEEKHFLVVSPWESPAQGKEYGPYDGIRQPVFGLDSMVVCLVLKEGKWRTLIGGREGENYDGVGDDTAFTPDGAKIAYAANKGGHQDKRGLIGGKWFMVVSPAGKPAAVKEGPAYDMVVTPVF